MLAAMRQSPDKQFGGCRSDTDMLNPVTPLSGSVQMSKITNNGLTKQIDGVIAP